MHRLFSILTLSCALVLSCFLVSCSTTHPSTSATPGSEEASATESTETYGIGNEANVLGEDVGPRTGVLGIRSFYFEFDKSDLNAKDLPAIKAHAQYLLEHSSARIVIEGNCDSRGSREYNIGLGQRRADAVMHVLKMAGVPSSQIRTLSYGSEKPIAMGQTEEAYRLNRRADIVYEAN